MGSLLCKQTRRWIARLGDEVLPQSGMCVAMFRCLSWLLRGGGNHRIGGQAIYPGRRTITASAQKRFPASFSHFNITQLQTHHQKEYDLFYKCKHWNLYGAR